MKPSTVKRTDPPDQHVYQHACEHLARQCPIMGRLITAHGPCLLRPEPDRPLALLVRCVIAQQISTKAAITIRKRLEARVGHMTPRKLAALSDEDYRACGFSGQKVRTVRAILERVQAEPAFLRRLPTLPDEQLRAAITSIKGLGPWSADMLLMFGFGRLDILPVGDLVIQVAMQQHWQLAARPKADQMLRLAEPWRPYRTIASWYLWRSRDDSDEW